MKNLTNDLVLVVGGNGKTGRRVAQRLHSRGVSVRLGSRRGAPPFSWEDPSTWPAALEGVSKVYLTYQPDLAVPSAPPALEAFGRAAREAGATRIVLLSGRGEPQAVDAENALRRTDGLALTVLRASWFAQNFDEGHLLDSVRSGLLSLPGEEVGEPFIDIDDIADVAVASLLDDRHVGQIYELTGPRLLTFREVAEELSEASGRPITYVPATSEEFRAGLSQVMPPEEAAFFADLFTFLLDGHNATTTTTVERVLGRPAIDFRAYARKAAQTGVWAR